MNRLLHSEVDILPRLAGMSEAVVVVSTDEFKSVSRLEFECRLVPNGTNGEAEVDFQIDGEILTVEADHDDDGVAAGTYSVRIYSALAEDNVLEGLLDGITQNTAARTPIVTRVIGESASGPWARGLVVGGTHTLNVIFSTDIATTVTVVVWYLRTERIVS